MNPLKTKQSTSTKRSQNDGTSKPAKSKVSRYPEGTLHWKAMMDYYEQVAKDAERLGKKLKAKRYYKKAFKVFCKAGGFEIKI